MLQACKNYYNLHLLPFHGPPSGSFVGAIDRLEDDLGFRLPPVYREFLAWMGSDHDGVFRGSDWFTSDIVENTAYIPDLLQDNGIDWPMPERYVGFFVHQGYLAGWFEVVPGVDDPLCWEFLEGTTAAPREAGPFSEYLLQVLKTTARPGRYSW